ncbi:hypothetical protein J6590_030058 [Homalodisca vitripennis]|nr:hypothetical protein J6590_030058 [Homalodisca vitripennis]
MMTITELRGEHKFSLKAFNDSYELLNNKLDDNTGALKQNTDKMSECIRIIHSLPNGKIKFKEKTPDSGVAPADLLKIKQARRSYRINHDQLNNLLDKADRTDSWRATAASAGDVT